MKEYVLGVVFWQDKVLTLYKTKGPLDLIGKYNGIGGKVEEHEIPVVAMTREFFEETNVKNYPIWSGLDKFSLYKDIDYNIHVFYTRLPDEIDFSDIKNPEPDGEYLQWFNYDEVETNARIDKLFRIYTRIAKILEGR